MSQLEINNPFQYLTPESIKAYDANKLFVDVFKDYYQVLNLGNTFMHGPRGSGKSMMFRVMRSDCQMLQHHKSLHEIKFYSIYIPIKDNHLNISELTVLEKMHGGSLLNEHYLVMYFTIRIFDTLSKEDYSQYQQHTEEVKTLYHSTRKLLKKCGYTENIPDITKEATIQEYFTALNDLCGNIQSDFFSSYLARIVLGNSQLPYIGPLCLYSNFLSPIITLIKELSFLPHAPIYLLIDDADELNLIQTKILNTWVSFRTTDVCFKISTQLKYQTFFTTKGSKIDTPHDYFEITLNQIYTSEQKERYLSNVKDIVEKRLELYFGKKINAEDFFPKNEIQDRKIQALSDELYAKKYLETADKQKASDYVYRNARPEYMKSMPNKYSYSYAGFEQLAHLSSGIIRNFLDLAALMYTKTYNIFQIREIIQIPVNIQDEEIERFSNKLLLSEFDKLIEDKVLKGDIETLNDHKRLRNLIEALGSSFRIILLSNSSERRKFSFYCDGDISDATKRVLKLGIIYGYFHKSSLGSKNGLGRSSLYVLNRMLAPYYKLDPLSFSGYLFLTPEMIDLGISNPKSFINKIKRKDYDYDSEIIQQQQLELKFEDDIYGTYKFE